MTPEQFFTIEKQIIDAELDADLDSFSQIKKRLLTHSVMDLNEFTRQIIYVILVSGFSQRTAKIIHKKIMDYLMSVSMPTADDLLKIFNNKNKINAIVRVWENKKQYHADYYKLKTLDEKLNYLATLPHIGKITANHLARNLGENVFKRDVWIERLLKKYGENLLEDLSRKTKLPIGYIDVVLWKSCQIGLIKL
ncbi:MAG: hypothetical protein LBL75_00635 [Rickettsiales bacterium]|jgi:hypothetical protein|nr:hypothetical protein [Rickettsiales bacterium]